MKPSVSGFAVSLLVSVLTVDVAVSLLVSGLTVDVAVSLLVSGLTVDILSTFCGVSMVQCVKLMLIIFCLNLGFDCLALLFIAKM